MAFGMVGPIITEPQDHLGLTEAPNYNAPFEVYAPAVWEQAQEILSIEAVTDYAHLGRVRGSESGNVFGQAWDGFFGNEKMSPESRIMDPEEATEEYGFDLEGNKILNFKDPISVDEAKLKRSEKIAENQRLLVISRIEGFWPTVTEFSLDIVTGFADPLALAAVYFPYFRGVRTFGKGFVEASLGTGVIIAPGVVKEQEFQKEWGVTETLFTMGLGGVIGGTISKGLGMYAARKMEGVEKDVQDFVDALGQETIPLEGDTLARFQVHLGEALETGKINSFDSIDNIVTLQQAVQKQQDLNKEVKRLVDLRRQLQKYEDSPEKIEFLRQLDEAIKENRILLGQVKKIKPVQDKILSSPGFKTFFKGSKVVDENNEPLVVYHGTNKDIKEFKIDSHYKAIFFTDDPNDAAFFASLAKGEKDNVIMPAYVNLKNPYRSTNPDDLAAPDALIKKAKDLGHDGIIVRAEITKGFAGFRGTRTHVIAFKPGQIKSRFDSSFHIKKDKPAPKEEYGPEVKFTRIEDSIPKESKKGLTRQENRERIGRRNAELQRQLDIIAMRSIGALDDPASQNMVRNALRKLLSEFPDPEVVYWIKTAPYEDIDAIIKKVLEKRKFTDYDIGDLKKERWDIKEPIDEPTYHYEGATPEDEKAIAKIVAKFEAERAKGTGKQDDTQVTGWDLTAQHKAVADYMDKHHQTEFIHKEPRYSDWRAKSFRNLFKEEINKRSLTIGKEAYQKNLSDFKSTVSRAASDDLEAPDIPDKPDVPNNYTTAESAQAVADGETLNIVNDMTSGQATTGDDLGSLIGQARKSIKTIKNPNSTAGKKEAFEIREYIAKLKKMEIQIKNTKEKLNSDKDVQDSIEGAGNCINDDVPL